MHLLAAQLELIHLLMEHRVPILSSLTTLQPVQVAQTDGTSNTNFGQTSGGVTNVLGQGTFGQLSTTQDAVVVQSSPVVNPFGTLAAMP